MTRIYRLFVEVRIEGDADTVPTPEDLAEEVSALVTDADNYNLEAHVIPIEFQDCVSLRPAPYDARMPVTDAVTPHGVPRRGR